MSNPHPLLPSVSLGDLNREVEMKRPLVIIEYVRAGVLCSTLCQSKEEYVLANLTLLFHEEVEPESILTFGIMPEDWI